MTKTAVIDASYTRRYILGRMWDGSKPYALFIMLNPSTADDRNDDPTIRRCVGFAQNWGFGGIVVVNLFSIISPDPKRLRCDDPVGCDNDKWIGDAAESAGIIVAAWGAFSEAKTRAKAVLDLLAARRFTAWAKTRTAARSTRCT